MNEYSHSYRVAPLWAVLLLTIPAGLAAWGVAASSANNTLAGTPLILLIAYGLAAGYVNRSKVHVNEAGVTAEFGPLPVGARAVWVARDEIASVYVRHTYMPARSGPVPYLAAGVEAIDGRWLDLTEPLAEPGDVWRDALAIAAALNWPEPLAQDPVLLEQNNRKLETPERLWGGILAGGVLWAIYATTR